MNYLTRDMQTLSQGATRRARQAARDQALRELQPLLAAALAGHAAKSRQLEGRIRLLESQQARVLTYEPRVAYERGMTVTFAGSVWQASENTALLPGGPGSGWKRLATVAKDAQEQCHGSA